MKLGTEANKRINYLNAQDTISRISVICLVLIATIATGAALRWLAPLMIPFTLALFTAFVLTQLAESLMMRFRFPRLLAVGASVTIAILMFTLVINLVTSSLGKMRNNLDSYQTSVQQLGHELSERLPLDKLGMDPERDWASLAKVSAGNVRSIFLGATNAILDLLKSWLLVFIFVLFMLIGWRGDGQPPPGIRGQIQASVRRFLIAKTIISAVTGILVGTILTILDVDLALVFGVFAFLLNFIPSIGSIIATLLPMPLVLISPDATFITGFLAIALPGAVQISIGNFVEPKIMGDSLDMHPVTIILSLIFWGMLWGPVGMFLATPIAVIIKIFLDKNPSSKPLSDLMGGDLGPLLGEPAKKKVDV